MKHEGETAQPAPVGQVERGVGRPVPKRDLVERLREGSANWALDETMQEAAAEIDRLRSTQDDALTQTMLMWNAAWIELPESVRERCWPDENPLASGIRLLLARGVTPNARLTAPDTTQTMTEQTQPAVACPVEPTVRPHRPHWTVRNCIWGGMAWTVSLTTPTKLELGARLYSRGEVDAMLASERERLCAAIKAADDKASEGDYMLDSDDCISVIRGTWSPGA